MATVYQCSYRHFDTPTIHCSEMNQGKRAKCKYCGSGIRAVEGHAVVIPWRGDGRYQLGDAVAEYATWSAAEKAADRAYEENNNSDLVARFII